MKIFSCQKRYCQEVILSNFPFLVYFCISRRAFRSIHWPIILNFLFVFRNGPFSASLIHFCDSRETWQGRIRPLKSLLAELTGLNILFPFNFFIKYLNLQYSVHFCHSQSAQYWANSAFTVLYKHFQKLLGFGPVLHFRPP